MVVTIVAGVIFCAFVDFDIILTLKLWYGSKQLFVELLVIERVKHDLHVRLDQARMAFLHLDDVI
jgi:hypothetical protein